MATGGGPPCPDSGQLNCPICLETFKCPRSLTCLHTFCDGCLRKYICDLGQKGALKAGFPCPMCRRDMLVPEGGEPVSSWAEKFKVNRFIIDRMSGDIANTEVDQMCGPCSVVDISSPAQKYCMECSEFLCDKCVRQHQRLKGTKSHILIQTDELKSNAQFAFDQSDLQMCCKHPSKEVEFFCKDDNSLCCSICVAFEHKRCTDIVDLNTKAVGIKKQGVQESLGKLSQLLIQIQDMVKTNTHRHDKVESQTHEISQKMKSLRSRINVLMDELERSVCDKCTSTKKEEVLSITDQNSRLQSQKAAIESSISLLEVICRHGSEMHVLIANCKVQDQIENYSKFLKDEESKLVTVDMEFNLDTDFERKLLMSSNLGEVVVTRNIPEVSYEYSSNVSEHFCRPRKLKDVEISSPTIYHASGLFAKPPMYTSACHLPDGRLVLVDCTNFTCCLYDDSLQYLTHVNIGYKAHSVRTLGVNHIAISSYNHKCLEVMEMTDKFKYGRKIANDTAYFGMDFIGRERFICMTSNNPSKELRLTTMDTNLNITSSISADKSGRNFYGSTHVKYDKVSSTLYQSSWKDSAVYAMSMDGTPKFTYKHKDLIYPRGIEVDRDGNIYICAEKSHNIHHLSCTDGKLIRIISDKKMKSPEDISFHPVRDEFIVTCGNTVANVLLFRLT